MSTLTTAHDMLCSFFLIVGDLSRRFVHRGAAHISFTWLPSCGQQLLLLLFTTQWSGIKRMLRIWRSCFTCMCRMAVGMADQVHQCDATTDMKALNQWGYYLLILKGSWAFGTIKYTHDIIEPSHKILLAFCS